MNLILLATAWGPKYGGINAFNRDFAVGLAHELGDGHRVFCAVLDPSDRDFAEASFQGVTLVPIHGKHSTEVFDSSWIFDIHEWLKREADQAAISWWIGHDVITGSAALRGPGIAGGAAAVIHHMSYASYQGFKDDSSVEADLKHQEQRALFREVGSLYAVGPLLRQSGRALSGRDPIELVPGFPDLPPSRSTQDCVTAITFGRMDASSDRIKQGRLAVAGFGEAVRRANATGMPATMQRPLMYVLGINVDLLQETSEIKSLCETHAGQGVAIYTLPFDEERDSMFQRLSECNLAMMLSWHEGFGLTGWEAIAAEVPVIISQHSGVYKLIDERLGGQGTGCLRSVNPRGRRGVGDDLNFTEEDLDAVAKAILQVSSNLGRHKADAATLKVLLTSKLGCTWGRTAQQFLEPITKMRAPRENRGKENSKGVQSDSPTLAGRPGSSTPTAYASAPANRTAPFTSDPPQNPVPECAELTAGTTQGSSVTKFDLLPELRFGRQEFEVEDLSVSYGLIEAAVRVDLVDCQISPGTRLGDEEHPNVQAKGNNTWRITGPKDDGILVRRALGAEPLCSMVAEEGAKPQVTFEVTCRPQNVSYRMIPEKPEKLSITETRILEAFFNRCINVDKGLVKLCRATMKLKDNG